MADFETREMSRDDSQEREEAAAEAAHLVFKVAHTLFGAFELVEAFAEQHRARACGEEQGEDQRLCQRLKIHAALFKQEQVDKSREHQREPDPLQNLFHLKSSLL